MAPLSLAVISLTLNIAIMYLFEKIIINITVVVFVGRAKNVWRKLVKPSLSSQDPKNHTCFYSQVLNYI